MNFGKGSQPHRVLGKILMNFEKGSQPHRVLGKILMNFEKGSQPHRVLEKILTACDWPEGLQGFGKSFVCSDKNLQFLEKNCVRTILWKRDN